MNVLKKDSRNPIYRLPIYGAAADIKLGAFLKRGPTPATDNGMLIKASGASAIPDVIGRIGEGLDYSVDGETLIAGTAFVTKLVTLAQPFNVFRVEYDLTSLITCTQAVSTTTMTVSSLEDNIDAHFQYVMGGTGIGQTIYAVASASGACTLKAAYGTALDTSSTFIKILPRFHQLLSLNSDGTKIASQAAAGAIKGIVIDTIIERNSDGGRQMDPTKHAALTGLNGARSLRFYADITIRDTIPYSVD